MPHDVREDPAQKRKAEQERRKAEAAAKRKEEEQRRQDWLQVLSLCPSWPWFLFRKDRKISDFSQEIAEKRQAEAQKAREEAEARKAPDASS